MFLFKFNMKFLLFSNFSTSVKQKTMLDRIVYEQEDTSTYPNFKTVNMLLFKTEEDKEVFSGKQKYILLTTKRD